MTILCIRYEIIIPIIIIEYLQSRTLPVIYERRGMVDNTIAAKRMSIYKASGRGSGTGSKLRFTIWEIL